MSNKKQTLKTAFCFFLLTLIIVACNSSSQTSNSPTIQQKNIPFKLINTYNHNPSFFTQGFFYQNGLIFEGTGQYGNSTIYIYDLQSGKISNSYPLPQKYFGEGITLFNNNIFQLTWQNHECFVYNQQLQKQKSLPLPTEGWGITHNTSHIIISDGSDKLYFYDPTSWKISKTLQVTDQNGPMAMINELEWINDRIFANKWFSNNIYIINPNNGIVEASIDLSDLINNPAYNLKKETDNVLNGIAYIPQNKHLLITGKLWNKIFEIELLP